jgi:ubiquinol-cytochrome c reductase iron-sulfur subunit
MAEPPSDGTRPRVPRGLPVPPWRLASRRVAKSYEAAAERPTDPEGHTHPAERAVQDNSVTAAQTDPLTEHAASGLTTAMFVLSGLASIGFCVCYVVVPRHTSLGLTQNLALGTCLGVALAGICVGLIAMAKTALPPVQAVQERPPHPAPPEDEAAAERGVLSGPVELGLAQRRMVRRSLLGALSLLPLPFVFGLRDAGPKLGDRLAVTSWKANDRMVDPETRIPVRLGDLAVGAVMTVMPEGFDDTNDPVAAESAVLLIRLPLGVDRPLPHRAGWSVAGVVAYSKVCTHAGCPVGLYEHDQETLLCPCHQSTFDVPRGCRVIFGPAARPLPQLPIHVDAAGYLRATAGFDQPVGPSYWERG